jgi:uroporphyrin-III C-methyltransferase/precorrin-2 dehydrogenase/sirohydrochlorin ferrochelatase
MSGFVSLVGAGPGDPELLTRRAARRLAEADVVLYDALVAPEVLELAPRALKIGVGKRAGRPSTTQEAIHRAMIRAARGGRRVVRLKGGDPFVFGRGGEEALALVDAGVPFEVVPGISSALAAPALAGIPVTHRGVASAFTVVSGHAESAWKPVLKGITPGSQTLVVLMGLSMRRGIAGFLLERGWSAATPSAIVFAAATAEQSVWTGRLDALGSALIPEGLEEAPATLVIGDVVALAPAIGSRAPSASRRVSSVFPSKKSPSSFSSDLPLREGLPAAAQAARSVRRSRF